MSYNKLHGFIVVIFGTGISNKYHFITGLNIVSFINLFYFMIKERMNILTIGHASLRISLTSSRNQIGNSLARICLKPVWRLMAPLPPLFSAPEGSDADLPFSVSILDIFSR